MHKLHSKEKKNVWSPVFVSNYALARPIGIVSNGYDRSVLSEGHKNYFKDWTQSQPFQFLPFFSFDSMKRPYC